ncbi:hypothetical protein BH11PSE11_BH11PSE11_36750 [soil metagenome]
MMRAATRQQVTGVVVNQRTNVRRAEFDSLKAILTNCIRHGPATQNRDQRKNDRVYLAGRIAYIRMINPGRAASLRKLFEDIVWPDQ